KPRSRLRVGRAETTPSVRRRLFRVPFDRSLFRQTSIRAGRRSARVLPLQPARYVVTRDPSLSYSGLEQAAEGRDPGIRIGVLHDECRFNLPGGGQQRFATRSVSSTDITAVGKGFSVCG